jgi:protein O-mannosyl-transferase
MAKNTNKGAQQGKQPASGGAGARQQRVQPISTHNKKIPDTNQLLTAEQRKVWLLAAGVAVVTFLVLRVCLQNKFTNWDDPGYVVNQPVIKDLSADGLRALFSTAIMGNYHPLTMLSYAVDYAISGLNPFSFHLQSLLFHIATTLMVFVFVLKLTNKSIAAAITALLFGIHPMHVESVAWVAGRKDVVYGFFYIASCFAYLFYLREGSKAKWYALGLVLYICSLLAKPVAVSLPVALLAIDYVERRPLKFNLLLEKIPHFLIALAAGVKSLFDQKVFGALGTQGETFNPIERIGLGGYALITYLWKAIVPIKLLCFYPYPLKVNDHLEYIYFVYPVAAALLIWVVWRFFRRDREVVFGVLFFFANIALLLQFIPVGGAIIADRYSYLPYIGLFFIAGVKLSNLSARSDSGQGAKIGLGIFGAYLIYLSVLSYERCKVWYDGMSLWRNVIEIEPERAPNGYNNLGFFYFNKFYESLNTDDRKRYYDSSFYLLSRAIELQPKFVNPYVSLAELQRTSAQYLETAGNKTAAASQFAAAKGNYYKALSLDTAEQAGNAYIGLAILYCVTGNYDSARFAFVNTLRLKPYNPEAHSNYANFFDMMHQYDSALVHYGIAVQQNPDFVASYLNRGRALQRMNRCNEAMRDFNKAIDMAPEMAEIYYARSFCYAKGGNKPLALQDVEKARSMGFTQIDPAYYQSLRQ